ncbi:hypothetical protein XENOCAPTIV_029378, partial [Xenoophorus captivus]
TNWNKAVQMCSKAREFALALAILECAIKPVVMLPVWKDSLGHTRMHRMTSMERDEKEKVKKREKKLEDEETLLQATWVKYTIPIKHQLTLNFLDVDEVKSNSPSPATAGKEPTQIPAEPKNEEIPAKIFYDVVNVSEGFQLRTAYKKKVKPSKLDGLLERRVKQFTVEEKQRLERMRQAACLSRVTATKPSAGVKTEGRTNGKQQQNALTSSVKTEETVENLQVGDPVVKKLDFDEESKKADSVGIKSEAAVSSQSNVAERIALHGNKGDDCSHKEVNGEPEPNSENNRLSETNGNNQMAQRMGENPKKRGYDEMNQGSGQTDSEGAEGAQGKSGLSQINCRTGCADSASRVQGDALDPEKEPVKSLMNGNLSRNELSSAAHQPPLKVPKLENHVEDKEESLNKGDYSAINREEPLPIKLESSSTSCHNSNIPDSCTSNEDVKTSFTKISLREPQNSSMYDTPNSFSKTHLTPPAESSSASSNNVPTTTQPSLAAAGSLRRKPSSTKMTVPASTSASSMMISKEYSTKDRVNLLRFSKFKKARSGTALPSYRKFVTKSSKKSIFVLPNDDLKRLGRKAGIKEVPIFSYNAKPAPDIWPYPSPRPTFGISWRYRLQTVRSLAGVSLMLRLLWACLRWDDMAVKPSAAVGTTRKDTDIITTEIIRRRDVGPHGIRSEYCIRKIICPIGNRDTPKETPTPQRKGLRSSALRPKKQEPAKQTGPVAGQGQTQGQLQIIPQGVTVIPGPGQQLMQAAMPNGQVQRFLFTPVAPSSTASTSAPLNDTPAKPATTVSPQNQIPTPTQGRAAAHVQTTPSALAQAQMAAPLPAPMRVASPSPKPTCAPGPASVPVQTQVRSTMTASQLAASAQASPQAHISATSAIPARLHMSSPAPSRAQPSTQVLTSTQPPIVAEPQVVTSFGDSTQNISVIYKQGLPSTPTQIQAVPQTLISTLTTGSPPAQNQTASLPPVPGHTQVQSQSVCAAPGSTSTHLQMQTSTPVPALSPVSARPATQASAQIPVSASLPSPVQIPTPALAPVSAPLIAVVSTQVSIPSPAKAPTQIPAAPSVPFHAAMANAVVTPVTATSTIPSVPGKELKSCSSLCCFCFKSIVQVASLNVSLLL